MARRQPFSTYLTDELETALRAFARAHGVTIVSVVQAALAAYLAAPPEASP